MDVLQLLAKDAILTSNAFSNAVVWKASLVPVTVISMPFPVPSWVTRTGNAGVTPLFEVTRSISGRVQYYLTDIGIVT